MPLVGVMALCGAGGEGDMANRHFAKIGDVWKHLPLAEILAIERPNRYWESHAGSAVYDLVDDAERRYGFRRFADAAADFPGLAASRYRSHVAALNGSARHIERYPGSATLAMLELGASASYLLCDLDPGSVSDLCAASARLGLDAQVDVRQRDGMTEIADALASLATDDRVIVHVDPYEPSAAGPGGMSALDLAAALITAGVGLVYWYGYDRPEDRGWAFDRLSSDAPAGVLWSGDMMVTSATSAPHGGHFGTATTPGTGCGLVCANLSSEAIAAAQRLGDELVAAYDGAALPHGSPGRLDFTVL